MVEDVWCMAMLTSVMMSRFLLFESGVKHGMIIWHANDFAWWKHVFSFKVQGSKHCYRDQDPEMHECMMKNLLCSAFFFWSFFFRVNCSLCNNQTHCFFYAFEIEECHKLQSLMFKMIIHMTFSLATSCMLAWIHRQVKNEDIWKSFEEIGTTMSTRLSSHAPLKGM